MKNKKISHCKILNKNKQLVNIELTPVYKAEEFANICARFEQHAEAKRWFPEFFGDKRGQFIIVDEETGSC